MAWQIDEDYSPLLANRYGTKCESGVGKCNDFCESKGLNSLKDFKCHGREAMNLNMPLYANTLTHYPI